MQVGSAIKEDQKASGQFEKRNQRKNHIHAEKLLAVPRYSDLLEDMEAEDESERGRALVNAPDTWRIEVAKWIGRAREAEERAHLDADSDDDEDEQPLPSAQGHSRVKWKPVTLNVLFGGATPRSTRVTGQEMDEEVARMETLAELMEDERLDDGAIEIGDEDVYAP